MATARKLPSGSWRCQVYDYTDSHGKRFYKSFTSNDQTSQGKRDAEQQAADFAAVKESQSRSTLTLDASIDKYIGDKKNVLSPSTIRGYRNHQKVLNKVSAKLMKTVVTHIHQKELQSNISEWAKNKSPKTVRNYYSLVETALKYQGVHIQSCRLPQEEVFERKIPTDKDIAELLKYSKGKELEVPIMPGAYCMMRRGEICGLSIDDLGEDNVLHIHHSYVMGDDKKFYNKSPKTVSSDRYIEIPEFVADTIRQKPRFFCPYQNLIKLCNTKYNTTIKKSLNNQGFLEQGKRESNPH